MDAPVSLSRPVAQLICVLGQGDLLINFWRLGNIVGDSRLAPLKRFKATRASGASATRPTVGFHVPLTEPASETPLQGVGQASSLEPSSAPGPKPCGQSAAPTVIGTTSLRPDCMSLMLLPMVIVTVSDSHGCCIDRRVMGLHLAILKSMRARSKPDSDVEGP